MPWSRSRSPRSRSRSPSSSLSEGDIQRAAEYNASDSTGSIGIASLSGSCKQISGASRADRMYVADDCLAGPCGLFFFHKFPRDYVEGILDKLNKAGLRTVLAECEDMDGTYMGVAAKPAYVKKLSVVGASRAWGRAGDVLAKSTVVECKMNGPFFGQAALKVALAYVAEPTAQGRWSQDEEDERVADMFVAAVGFGARLLAGSFGGRAQSLLAAMRRKGIAAVAAAWQPFLDNSSNFYVHTNMMLLIQPCEVRKSFEFIVELIN